MLQYTVDDIHMHTSNKQDANNYSNLMVARDDNWQNKTYILQEDTEILEYHKEENAACNLAPKQ